jgi:hypothetical protein
MIYIARMKRILALAAAFALSLSATPAEAVEGPRKPCGRWTLWATHAATASSFDINGDRFECYNNADYTPPGRDNRQLPTSRSPYKFYAWGLAEGVGVTSVDLGRNDFTGNFLTQEDDQDMNGCSGNCFEELSYDRNDLFYIDFGRGSRKVRIGRFENNLQGADQMSMIYAVARARTSIFSVDLT